MLENLTKSLAKESDGEEGGTLITQIPQNNYMHRCNHSSVKQVRGRTFSMRFSGECLKMFSCQDVCVGGRVPSSANWTIGSTAWVFLITVIVCGSTNCRNWLKKEKRIFFDRLTERKVCGRGISAKYGLPHLITLVKISIWAFSISSWRKHVAQRDLFRRLANSGVNNKCICSDWPVRKLEEARTGIRRQEGDRVTCVRKTCQHQAFPLFMEWQDRRSGRRCHQGIVTAPKTNSSPACTFASMHRGSLFILSNELPEKGYVGMLGWNRKTVSEVIKISKRMV